MSLNATGDISATFLSSNGSTKPNNEGALSYLSAAKELSGLSAGSGWYVIHHISLNLSNSSSSFGNYVRPNSRSCKFFIKF